MNVRNLRYLIQHQFGISTQNSEKIVEKFSRRWRFRDGIARDFGSKTASFQGLLERMVLK